MLRRGGGLILGLFYPELTWEKCSCADCGVCSFGVAGVLLEMVPVAGIFFAFTNTCGAALWAADMERSAGSSPELRDQAKKAE